MAINNKLVPQQNTVTTVYESNGKEVRLTADTVRRYLISGNAQAITNEEIEMFINLCKFNGLNPWLKEAYVIKYGNAPATLVVGKEAYLKRAEMHPQYDGFEAGVIVHTNENEIAYRVGTVVLANEMVVGGWAEVFRKDRNHSTRIEVGWGEFAGTTKEGNLNNTWKTKPATMIRKVALVNALREAFPLAFGGMYTAEEQGYSEEETAPQIDVIEPVEVKTEKVEQVDDLPL